MTKSTELKGTVGNTNNGGIGFAGALGLLFVGLKLGHVIAWSWLWVLAPFWAPLIFALIVVSIFLICDAI